MVAATRRGPRRSLRALSRAAGSRVPHGCGEDDGFGQAEEPGGAVEGVVGVRSADELDAVVFLAGEEEGELVGFGAAGGDEGVALRASRSLRASRALRDLRDLRTLRA